MLLKYLQSDLRATISLTPSLCSDHIILTISLFKYKTLSLHGSVWSQFLKALFASCTKIDIWEPLLIADLAFTTSKEDMGLE